MEILFRHSGYIAEFIRRATGIVEGLIRLYTDDLFDIPVPFSSEEEQNAILSFLNRIDEKFSTAIRSEESQIEKLKEYKATLIDSAVTGKINVSSYK